MIEFAGRAILLDIEGTTSPISFVYDQMFPFARRELEPYVREHWGEAPFGNACEQIAADAGHDHFADWCGEQPIAQQQQAVIDEVIRLMDGDVKATGLKTLQGLIWKAGFDSGELVAEVYEDVPPALLRWNASGIDVRIYSSGSIAAQKMFFGHTIYGDLLPQFQGHYDTTTGPKKEPKSYAAIAGDVDCEPDDILFLSDVVAELDAAREAGMATGLVMRPGNQEPEPADHAHVQIGTFEQVRLML